MTPNAPNPSAIAPIAHLKDVSLVIWTTTPWTLPMNLAVMVGKDLDYVKVKKEGKLYIIGKARPVSYTHLRAHET